MNPHLGPGEHILWQGAPASGLRFTAPDAFAIPFVLFWLAMVVFIAISSARGDAAEADLGVFFILPMFLIVGLYMLVGRFIVDIAARRRTRYVLTNHRAIIESGIFSRTTRSVTLAIAPEITFRESRKGRGTIEFGTGVGGPFGMLPRNWPGAGQYRPPTFEGIDDARRVYGLILTGQRRPGALD